MRRFSLLIAPLALAACSTDPKLVVAPPREVAVERGDLIGASASDLATRFGTPRLTVREGDSTKLQFAAIGCLLDAYLYLPVSGTGVARVTHVDTRDRAGARIDQQSCLALLESR